MILLYEGVPGAMKLEKNIESLGGSDTCLISTLFESESEVAQSCRTLCDPMDYSLPGFSVHGIFQARVLEWDAISFSRGSSQARDRTCVAHIVGRRFTL